MSRLVLAIATLAACSSSNAKPTAAQYDDTAQQLGTAVATRGNGGELGSISDVVTLARGATVPCFTADGTGQVTGTHLGLTYRYGVSCRDASGAALASCGSQTDGVTATVDWSGELVLPTLTATVDRSGAWTITDLQRAAATLDGTSSFALDASVTSIFRPVTTTYALAIDARYDAVQIDTARRLPIGGSITYDVSATDMSSDASSELQIHAVVSFAADSSATLVLDDSVRYTLSPTTGVVVRVD